MYSVDAIAALAERTGKAETAALPGLITGAVPGVAARSSCVCQRAATVGIARDSLWPHPPMADQSPRRRSWSKTPRRRA